MENSNAHKRMPISAIRESKIKIVSDNYDILFTKILHKKSIALCLLYCKNVRTPL